MCPLSRLRALRHTQDSADSSHMGGVSHTPVCPVTQLLRALNLDLIKTIAQTYALYYLYEL